VVRSNLGVVPRRDGVQCFFASDLHGRIDRYRKLLSRIEADRPDALFLGGDLLPMPYAVLGTPAGGPEGFVTGFLAVELGRLRDRLGDSYPEVFLILGNDDPRSAEGAVLEAASRGIWHYAHDRRVAFGDLEVYGYSCIPPSPFLLKDWEQYDVSRFVDPGSVSPEEGRRTVPRSVRDIRNGTIQQDLERLAGKGDLARAILLFHSPPYETKLDRAALDGRSVDHAPLDVHTGSIAIRRFIVARQPLITLHGHVHESARLSGEWRDRIGRTHLFSAAHDGPELALVRFDPDAPDDATREIC
jgi:Icc-related predicted phosphoesterase